MTIAELVVRFAGDIKPLTQSFGAAERATKSFVDQTGKARDEFGRFVGGAQTAGQAVAKLAQQAQAAGRALTVAVSLPLALAAGSAVLAARDMDSLRRGLEAVSGSSTEAQRQLGRLEEVAKLPGLGFREVIKGSTALQAAGFSANLAERSLMAFGNALATVGKGKADLDGVTLALSQIASKGKISAEEINQIAERVPQIRQAMKAAFGTANTEALQKAGIDATEFVSRITDELNKLPRVTGGVGNAFENMSDAMFRARAAVGEALLPALLPLVEGFTKLLVQVRSVSPETMRTVIAFGAVAAAAGPLLLVVSSLITALTALSAALSIGLLPLIAAGGPILIALGLVAAAFVKTGLDAMAAAANAQAAAEQFRAALRGMNEATLGATLQAKSQSTTALLRARAALEQELRDAGAPLEAPKRPTVGRALLASATRRPGQLGPVLAENESITRARDRLATVNQMITDRTREMGDISQELNARQTAAITRPTPVVVPAAGAGADKLRGVRDIVDDLVRSLRTLQMFGVTSADVLPQNVTEKIRAFEELRNRVDRLSDALGRMGAAAPPEGLRALTQLRAELQGAEADVSALAENFNRALREIAARPINTQVQINANAMLAGSSLRGSVDAELGLNRFGASLTATGSLLGDLNAPLLSVSSGLNLLRESALSAGRMLLDALSQAVSAGGQFASNIQSGMQAGAAAPQAIALAAAMEVATGFFQALAPAMDALTLPLRLLGEVLATLVLPVVRILFPVFKAVAIVASFLAEIIARVVSAILNAAGGFVKGLGKLINAITPFANPGNPLVKAGEALQRTAGSFSAAADEMKAKRKEIQNLSFEDAMNGAANAANRLTESLTNMPPLFDLVLRRIQASRGMSPEAPALRSAAVPSFSGQASTPTSAPVLQMIFQEGSIPRSPNASAEEIASAVWSKAISRLSLGPAEARTMANTLRIAGVAG